MKPVLTFPDVRDWGCGFCVSALPWLYRYRGSLVRWHYVSAFTENPSSGEMQMVPKWWLPDLDA